MEVRIPEGLICREEYIVTEEHAAKHVGSGEVEVLSTPSMILFMEMTALKCVQKYLPEGFTTVGIAVNVRHRNPAPINDKILVEVQLKAIEGKKLVFEVKALWRDVLIGDGIHERYIVDKAKFIEKLRKLVSKS